MRKRLLAPGLTLALAIAGRVGAMPPSTVADVVLAAPGAADATTVFGRVTSVSAAGNVVTIEAAGGSTALSGLSAGDHVQLRTASLSANATHAQIVSRDGARPLNAAPSRHLLGVWLLTMSGAVIVLRVRRRRTLLISAHGGRKRVDAPVMHHSSSLQFRVNPADAVRVV